MLTSRKPAIKPNRLTVGEFTRQLKRLLDAQKLRGQKIHGAEKEQNTAKQACII
jgi:hypothetical protein